MGVMTGTAAAVLTLLAAVHGAAASFERYGFPEIPVRYDGYRQQCGVPITCPPDRCPDMEHLQGTELRAYKSAIAELKSNEQKAKNACYRLSRREFDFSLFDTKPISDEDAIYVNQSLKTEKFLTSLAQSLDKCQLKNLLDGNCPGQFTIPCVGQKLIKCDPTYRYQSYDGSCNNLQHATWGMQGNALKRELAPCYSDVVSQPADSASGCRLPLQRKVISELKKSGDTAEVPVENLNLFSVFFSELINSDRIGRANRRVKYGTGGFRGCRADAKSDSLYQSVLSSPMRVPEDDPHYGPLNIRCLNYSPQEKANDNCNFRHSSERNLESAYLDLSSVYGNGQYDAYGKLNLSICGASQHKRNIAPIGSVQLFAIAGLFTKFHNYCVDRVHQCGGCQQSSVDAAEKCRALTIGVYQKLIYTQLLPELFGEQFFQECNFNCQYNADVESAVSLTYKSALGRFQHVWIPNSMYYPVDGDRCRKLPFNVFFRNHRTFDCSAALLGAIRTPIQTVGLSDALANKFYTKDNVTGACLPCIDLTRSRDAGLCSLLTFKHYLERQIGYKGYSKCYKTFDDLDDIFSPRLIHLLRHIYEKPEDIEMLFAVEDNRDVPDLRLPLIVAQATCLEFKRAKCTDRFFYTWNPYLTDAARRLIDELDFTSLLALFTSITEIPTKVFLDDSETVPAAVVRTHVESLNGLFCKL